MRCRKPHTNGERTSEDDSLDSSGGGLVGSRHHKAAPGVIIYNGTVFVNRLDRVRSGFIYEL